MGISGLDFEQSELLRVVTAGSVDDGKSTLIGRLLYDSKQVYADQLAAIEQASQQRGDERLDLALLTDGLRAEREQGITIDVAYRYFSTPRRKFIIADSPGHARYTRNMVTGASTADLAIVLIDARKGLSEQSRRHAFIASLLGIPHLVVAINKMDLVDYKHGVYERIVFDFVSFAARLKIPDITFVPISALYGDNIVERSPNMPWYEGASLLYRLETVHVASDRNLIDARLPVQWVIRPQSDQHQDFRGYAGKVAGGIWRPGEEVVALPSGQRSRIRRLDSYDGPLAEAFPEMNVTVSLEDELDISRGEMLARPQNQPQVSREIEAMLCWMDEQPLSLDRRYLIRHTTREAYAQVSALRYRIDMNTLKREDALDALALNDIGRVRLTTTSPLAFDAYRQNRATGGFVLIDPDSNHTVAAGMILGAAGPAAPNLLTASRSPNVRWDEAEVTRPERQALLGQQGATVWLTGLPSSGKSTIATALEARLIREGHPAYRLDGDNLRHGLNGNLGFDRDSRAENIRRTAHVARLFADAGLISLVSLVSPYAEDRQAARSLHQEQDLPFVEVWVSTPLAECERRDAKGLYAKARRGEISGMTGVDDPYQPPLDPELEVDTAQGSIEQAVESIMGLLRAQGVLGEKLA